MLAYFPALYEDELLYSWLARYHEHSGNTGPKQTMKDLFDNENEIAVPDLPTNLDSLCNAISHFKVPEVTQLINKHTMYKYYSAFVDESKRNHVFEAMRKGDRKSALHTMFGIMASVVQECTYFCYCPNCLEEDYFMLGETYWRVSHQLPGVLVCLKHHEYLRQSSVLFRSNQRHAFTAATKTNCNAKNTTTYSKKTKAFLNMVAIEANKLIEKDWGYSKKDVSSSY